MKLFGVPALAGALGLSLATCAPQPKANVDTIKPRTVLFSLEQVPLSGDEQAGIRGDTPPLNWAQTYPMKLTEAGYQAEIDFAPTVTTIAYKFVIESEDDLQWERIRNRSLLLDQTHIDAPHLWNITQQDAELSQGVISGQILAKDLPFIKTAILDLHPGAYRYASKEEMNRAFDELSTAFRRGLTQQQAYLVLSRFLATIKCDHTYANFYNQRDSVKAQLVDGADKLPFVISWIDDDLIISRSVTDVDSLPAGTKILSINGVTSDALAAELLGLISADGPAERPRFAKAGITGYRFRIDPFDVFQPMIIPPQDGTYILTIEKPGDDQAITVSVPSISRTERSSRLEADDPSWPRTEEDLWALRVLGDGTAYLKIGTFITWQFETDWQEQLDQAFRQIRNVGAERLIVDLRGNTGGADAPGQALLQNLIEQSCTVPSLSERARYAQFPQALKDVSSSWNDNWLNLSARQLAGHDYLSLPREADHALMPGTQSFGGDVAILTGPQNASGAFYFARAARACGLPLIGERTGGSRSGINGGQIVFVNLPNSGLEFDFPIIGTFADEPTPQIGIDPDIVVSKTRSDIRFGTNPVIARAIDFLEKRQRG